MTLSRPEGALKAIHVSPAGRVWIDAGRLGVDLAMTGPPPELLPAAARWEQLHEPADLADWLTACTLGLGRLDVTGDDLSRALELRVGLWGMIRAALESRPLPRRAIATVNAYAAGAPLVPQLAPGGRRWSAPTVAQALATIARDAIDLHADSAQLIRLHECASADCGRVFYDTSRPGTRRWCDPVRCGDRQRARAYRRHRHHEMDEEH
jgi:predicted RNA-binding Zn ribbon-like protein